MDSIHHFNEYSFIAHAKIINAKLIEPDMTEFGREVLLTIRIVELFKGESVRNIIEFGKNTSCEIGMAIGEEWIIFGKTVDGNITVGACNPTNRYRDVAGSRIDYFGWSNQALFKLKKIFGHKDDRIKTGKRFDTLYNGQIEIEENVINGKLYGPRKTWHPNGKLWLEEYYINDSLNGKSLKYSGTGQVIEEKFFRMGKPTGKSRTFYDTTDQLQAMIAKCEAPDYKIPSPQKIQLSHEIIFDEWGRSILRRTFRLDGTINSETIMEPDRNFSTEISYHQNGRIKQMCRKLNEENYGPCRAFDTEGNLIETWIYEKGKKKLLDTLN